jgi:hypothetical protein
VTFAFPPSAFADFPFSFTECSSLIPNVGAEQGMRAVISLTPMNGSDPAMPRHGGASKPQE